MLDRMKAALVAGLLAVPAWAHGPTPQEASRQVEIAAPAETVWEILKDPAALSDWHPQVASATLEGDGAGAKRTTELAGGSVLDGIDIVNDGNMTTRWRLSGENREVIPVSFYTNTIVVTPNGAGAEVQWKASFFRADTTNEPEESYSDAAAVTFMEQYIQDGLNGLKEQAEAAGS
ncbi:SRPBCC family protein [Paracoccus siganidrum]|uniref:SRPBCC family protein n=1 Tax=Paracoccus siganidrum TaxID=1276757 RepID=A0A418ZQN7_9RHOB|nr:SRPBCC family protein [Paracoccus siganidrum]RJK97455.1 SRPBCC family protein [Paracoccus siganidrum]RMC23797.1 SRPBCC family protein [Paracoccus siganidrum]